MSTAPARPAGSSPSATSPAAPPAAPSAPPSPPVGGSVIAPPPRWIGRAMLANLVCEIGIVVTGGLVRLTDSGLGCPTWPQCVPGSFTPVPHQAQGYHKDIEFGNRLLIVVLTVAAVAALWAAIAYRRHTGARRRFVWWGSAPLWGIAVQAVIGGITVRSHLSAITVAAHFLPSMAIVAVSTLLYLAVRDPGYPPERGRELRGLTAGVAALAGVILAMGTVVTGSGPHAGDAGARERFAFNPRDASWLHADVVLLFTGLVVGLVLVARLGATGPVTRRRTQWLVVVTLLQGVIGYLEYATKLPMLLVVTHMLGASLLVVAVTAVGAGVFGTHGLTHHPTTRDHAQQS
ncbi:MAG TPA: COX15/CtaA family protein [Kineosporiaceae bacterium]